MGQCRGGSSERYAGSHGSGGRGGRGTEGGERNCENATGEYVEGGMCDGRGMNFVLFVGVSIDCIVLYESI